MALNLGKALLFTVLIITFSGCEATRDPASHSIDKTKFLGSDLNGNKKECIDSFETLECSQEFMDSDQFALDCERSGKFAIQCGCHDWICVEKLSPAKKLSY